MSAENIDISSIFEDLIEALKETCGQIKKQLSAGVTEMLDELAMDLDPATVRVPILNMDWKQAKWYTLQNEVVLSDDVGIHPDSSRDIVLTVLPATNIKTEDNKERSTEEEILLMEGAFTTGVDFVFPASDGAIGNFLEIKAIRSLLMGKSRISHVISRATEDPPRQPSEEMMKFVEHLTSATGGAKPIPLAEKEHDAFMMVIEDDQGEYHLLVNDQTVVIHVGPDKACFKDFDRTWMQLNKKSPMNREPRLEVHVNEAGKQLARFSRC